MARLSVAVPLVFLGLCLVGETLSSICCVMPVAVQVACNRTTTSSPPPPIDSVLHLNEDSSDDGNAVVGSSQDASDQEQDQNQQREDDQDQNQQREDDQDQNQQREDDQDQNQQREDDQDQSQQREDDQDQDQSLDLQDRNAAGSDELTTDALPTCVAYYCGSVEHAAGNVPCSYGTCDGFGCHCTAECIGDSYRTKKSIR